jgi:hypothetical protein
VEDRDDFMSRFREANRNDGPDIFPTSHSRATPMGSTSTYTAPPRPASPVSAAPRVYRVGEDAPARGWGYWFLLAAVAVIAYGIGSLSHATAIPDHKPNQAAGEHPVDPVTVTVTKEVVVTKAVPQMPQACTDALAIATELAGTADPVINSGGRMEDLLKQARIAVAEKNTTKLNDIGTQLNTLENKTSGATQHLLDLQSRLAGKLKECNQDLGR